jgi:hypothetical protein
MTGSGGEFGGNPQYDVTFEHSQAILYRMGKRPTPKKRRSNLSLRWRCRGRFTHFTQVRWSKPDNFKWEVSGYAA